MSSTAADRPPRPAYYYEAACQVEVVYKAARKQMERNERKEHARIIFPHVSAAGGGQHPPPSAVVVRKAQSAFRDVVRITRILAACRTSSGNVVRMLRVLTARENQRFPAMMRDARGVSEPNRSRACGALADTLTTRPPRTSIRASGASAVPGDERTK